MKCVLIGVLTVVAFGNCRGGLSHSRLKHNEAQKDVVVAEILFDGSEDYSSINFEEFLKKASNDQLTKPYKKKLPLQLVIESGIKLRFLSYPYIEELKKRELWPAVCEEKIQEKVGSKEIIEYYPLEYAIKKRYFYQAGELIKAHGYALSEEQRHQDTGLLLLGEFAKIDYKNLYWFDFINLFKILVDNNASFLGIYEKKSALDYTVPIECAMPESFRDEQVESLFSGTIIKKQERERKKAFYTFLLTPQARWISERGITQIIFEHVLGRPLLKSTKAIKK